MRRQKHLSERTDCPGRFRWLRPCTRKDGQPSYNVDGRGVSAWIPVDPVPAAGCLELLAGSHRGPWLMPRPFLAGEAKWFREGSLAELPDIEADRGAFDIRRYDLEPGDAIFFDFLTVHGAPGFPFGGRRRVLSLRYLSGVIAA
jgi:ectoine hydroxylase-related dioxygenase (phytanoyl-CoA dioxygenase family)